MTPFDYFVIATTPLTVAFVVQTWRWHKREIRAGRREPILFGKHRT
jgi:hypothetical protein